MADQRQRRHYPPRVKAAAVGVALAEGQTAAAERLGIPLSTLHRWYLKPEMAELRTTARAEVADQMWIGVQVGIAEMVRGLQDPRTPLREKTDAASMLAEKYLLMTGQATARTETVSIADALPDGERERLADAIDAWLAETREPA